MKASVATVSNIYTTDITTSTIKYNTYDKFQACNHPILQVHSFWGLEPTSALPSARTLILHIIGYALVDEVLI